MNSKLLRCALAATTATLLAAGCGGQSPTSPAPEGGINPPPPAVVTYKITITARSVQAIGTCDTTSASGEFAVRVRITSNAAPPRTLYETSRYPGDPANPSVLTLRKGQSASISGSQVYEMEGPGRFFNVEFRATEWDRIVRIFPPSTVNVIDDTMNNAGANRDHTFGGGTFSPQGNQSLTIGNTTCGIRLNYSFSVEEL